MMDDTPDRIERRVVLRAPRRRVWRALADAKEFGQWFGAELEGAFAEGAVVRGRITYPGFEHVTLEMQVEQVEPERLLAFRWHPYAIDPAVDYSAEPTTLVELRVDDAEGGTLLRIVESGFSRLPADRREEAYRMDDEGWVEQMENLQQYVELG